MPELFVGRISDFKELDRKIVVHGDLEIGVFFVDGSFHAYQNHCRHRGGPVCQGKVINKVEEVLDEDKTSRGFKFSDEHVHIVCPWHGFEYDLKTGVNAGEPGMRLRKYEVKLRDGGIHVVV